MTRSRIEFVLPVGTKNTSKVRDRHQVRAKREKGPRQATELLWPGWTGPVLLVVRLTRVSPRLLAGGDSLPIVLKSVRDEVARQLRVDDSSPLVRWVYAQSRGESSVLVELSWGEDALAAAVRARDRSPHPPAAFLPTVPGVCGPPSRLLRLAVRLAAPVTNSLGDPPAIHYPGPSHQPDGVLYNGIKRQR
ncbi:MULTISPECIES: hypothetical protein [Myxococcus]|uniref:hypothetical protein n=1 Tax=Myxococcus TaxID=32 RepID=UPI0013D17FC0|nr:MULTISPECIES: hypothetical protein [Myxococcus]NVJ24034.1 hypothetical protein [Myxococcus sp. AM011]